MILSLKDIKYFIAFFLLLMLMDSSFAGFLPKAFEGDFIQTKKTLRGSKKAPVKIKYMYPQNIRMQVMEADNEITYVCNSNKTWIYTPPFMEGEKGHLREGASSKYCYSKIFDALKYGLESNKHYQVKKISDKKYQMTFVPATAQEVGFDAVQVNFAKLPPKFNNIQSFELFSIKKIKKVVKVEQPKKKSAKKNTKPKTIVKIVDKLKLELTLLNKNIKLLKSIDKKQFVFKAPKNTEIEQMK